MHYIAYHPITKRYWSGLEWRVAIEDALILELKVATDAWVLKVFPPNKMPPDSKGVQFLPVNVKKVVTLQ